MALVNITSASVGKGGEKLISLMINGNQALEQGSIHLVPGLGQTLYIPKLNVSDNIFQDRVETPTATVGSLDYDERPITPADILVYMEFNPNNWMGTWEQFYPNGMYVDTIDNPEVQAAIMDIVLKRIGQQMDALIWAGDSSLVNPDPLRYFDGFVTKALADANTIKVAPVGAITEANVISILESVEASIPSTIWKDPNVVFHMSTAVLRRYLAAARALDFKGTNITEAEASRFASRNIRFYDGFPDNHIMVAKATTGDDSNLWAGAWASGDESNLKISRLQANSELFFLKTLIKFDVNFANSKEVSIYAPA